MVITPSWTVSLTSSFFTSGRSALMRYSLSSSVIFLSFFLFLILPFAGDGHHAVLDRQFDVFLLHFRQIRLNEIFLIVLGDISFLFPLSHTSVRRRWSSRRPGPSV